MTRARARTGARNTYPPTRRIPDVRTLPCPSRDDLDHGNHDLVTDSVRGEAVTRCAWCRLPWAVLDGQLRTTRPAPSPSDVT